MGRSAAGSSQDSSAGASGAVLTLPGEDLCPPDLLLPLCLTSLSLVICCTLFKVMLMSSSPF